MAEAKKIRRLKISNDNYHRRNNTFIDDDTLPFPIHLNHKNRKKTQWKKRGMKIDDDDFDYVYNEYIHTTNCDLCNKVFLKSLDRQLDHCHNTGEVRNIVCNKCNHHKEDIIKNTNTGEIFIYKVNNFRMKNGYTFYIRIVRNETLILNTSRTILEDAIICRDEFLKNNNIFS